MKEYRKPKQHYHKTGPSKCYLLEKYDKNIFFIPTKAAPNPIKQDYQQQRASFLLKHKIDELKAKCNDFAFAASGWVWDDKFNKMASYQDLIHHHNEEMKERWLLSGKNEFGRLFRCFKPNNIDGLGVLDWIKNRMSRKERKSPTPGTPSLNVLRKMRYTAPESPAVVMFLTTLVMLQHTLQVCKPSSSIGTQYYQPPKPNITLGIYPTCT